MKKSILSKLKKKAKQGSKNAYSPYSMIKVGAAVLTDDRKIFFGSNVENMSYGGTVCAERIAIFKAVSEGYTKFKAIYLYTKEQWSPCGMCLQVMSEFCNQETIIILGSDTKEDIIQLKDLLPKSLDKKIYKKLQTKDK